ncbi:D-3-phosphoglycerate dehydrogenase [Acidimicrobium ferrooxidans DSM 10331]|uniref:D-3-phosphoglycerate dehydrogenase n=1 Tax=Acidimicrobium ferrooxidans (strain DSM 10331 / JCM 15462 / NBRC 103882 / ICP) TaxID=525909 RepID=C7M0E5_ACIFD|nr:phosphoglycerate dehydrogenase [Acidimicrobium ferrooxidans]ACU54453.1 D-3-phosphoglycerate dehydrogenase [Acidimicrobium ferrooxidans DSM 10331]
MARVLVTETIAEEGLQLLSDAGHEVVVRTGLDHDGLLEAVADADALIIRSATKVTADVLEAAHHLVVVGRAGIGLDNVDVETATKRGVMVVNAPQSNIVSAAEHTLALLLALARHVPQAHASVQRGEWRRSAFQGVELYGKTLGIIGLGRIGALVAQRANAFGMRLVAYDPYISQERARKMGVTLLDLDELMATSDIVTIHLPKSKETVGLVGAALLAKAKPGIRIVNASRGGIIDEAALAEAIARGHVAGAALDVFAEEPPTNSPIVGLDQVVLTPHLGASTAEAQSKAGVTIAEQVLLALANEFVPFAVNVNAGEASELVRSFLPLAEALGVLLGAIEGKLPEQLEIAYEGELASEDTRLASLAVLRGILSGAVEEPVSYVNAPQLAAERGLSVRESTQVASANYHSLLVVRSGAHVVGGTLAGQRASEPRVVLVDGHWVEVPPSRWMLVVRNVDRPGMVGVVGSLLGQAGRSIDAMAVSPRTDDGTALMVLGVDGPIPDEVLTELDATDGIIYARTVTCAVAGL